MVLNSAQGGILKNYYKTKFQFAEWFERPFWAVFLHACLFIFVFLIHSFEKGYRKTAMRLKIVVFNYSKVQQEAVQGIIGDL